MKKMNLPNNLVLTPNYRSMLLVCMITLLPTILLGDQSPKLTLYSVGLGGAEAKLRPLRNMSVVHSDDSIMVGVIPYKSKYTVIFSIDGKGEFRQYFPYRGGDDIILDTDNKESVLGHWYKVDYAKDFVRFFLVSSKKHFDYMKIISAGNELAKDPNKAKTESLKLSSDYNQATLILKKED